jgi:hypothetical protein
VIDRPINDNESSSRESDTPRTRMRQGRRSRERPSPGVRKFWLPFGIYDTLI